MDEIFKKTEKFQMVARKWRHWNFCTPKGWHCIMSLEKCFTISIKDKYLHNGLACPLQKCIYIFTKRHEQGT